MVRYWETRAEKFNYSKFGWLKNMRFFEILFSVKYAHLLFLHEALKLYKKAKRASKIKILDIACGAGQEVLCKYGEVYGVDISGFPKEVALKKGYKKVYEYGYPDYQIPFEEEFDIISVLNLNAHVSFEVFQKILLRGLDKLKFGGGVVIVAELNNDGLGYKMLKVSQKKFDRYVKGMQHDYFEYETEFMAKLKKSFPNLVLRRESNLVIIPPFSHYVACFLEGDLSGRISKIISWIIDFAFSILNNFLVKVMRNRENVSFLKGFYFERIE